MRIDETNSMHLVTIQALDIQEHHATFGCDGWEISPWIDSPESMLKNVRVGEPIVIKVERGNAPPGYDYRLMGIYSVVPQEPTADQR